LEPVSTSRNFWQRFRSNLLATIATGFIALAIVIALFAYIIAPDHTPQANNQIPEIALQKPGFQVFILEAPLNRQLENSNGWQQLWNGKPNAFRSIPIADTGLRIQGDTLYYHRFEKLGQTAFVVLSPGQKTLPVHTNYYPLGTDKYGRCIFSRLLLGFRVSLFVGALAVLISLSVGVVAGALAGYFGGRTDAFILLILNTIWSIPTLLLVFAIVLVLGRGVGIIFLAVGLTMWVDVARVVRGQVLALRDLPFVEAAKSMGLPQGRILFRHILPNLMGPVLVLAAANFATAILLESGLSYLGFGVQAPTPSWGSMLNENYGYAIGGKPVLALAPALAIALTVLAFNLVGNGLRTALDIKSDQ
jgi:peptide/nickel transport system permease protein